MAGLILDAGCLIAHERQDRYVEGWLRWARQTGLEPTVAAPTVAEVWRNAARQARLARLIAASDVVDCDRKLARAAGQLLAKADSSSTLDAIVVATAARVGGIVLTDDLHDMQPLGAAAGVKVVGLREDAGRSS